MTDLCTWSSRQRAAAVVDSALAQALAEAGIGPHPGGVCPSADCRCGELADSIEARMVELAALELGISAAELEASDA